MLRGSLRWWRRGALTLVRVRIDCWGRYSSGPWPRTTRSPAARAGANSGTTTCCHCQSWTGNQRYPPGSAPVAARVAVNASGGGRVELAGQQPVVGETGDGLVGGQAGAGGQPVEPHPGPPLGGVAQVVAVAEAEAALVGGDPGVPGHLALDLRVVQLQQLGRAGPAGGQVAVGHLGRPQLLEQVGGGGRGHPGGLAQVEQQPARVGGRRLAGLVAAPDRALADPPAVEQPPAGPEPVGDPAGQPHLPGARVAGDRLGGQQLLVQEPGQHLGHQGPPGPVPAVAGEDGAGLRVGVHVSRLRSR